MSLQRARQIGHRFGVDRAVGYAVAARSWQLITGQVTLLVIIFCLSDLEQGYYYSFVSLLATQIFVELGLHVVLINVASHEWAGLRFADNQIHGDGNRISRLVSLGRTSFVWYGVAAIVFLIAAAVSGIWFFRDLVAETVAAAPPAINTALEVSWVAPWVGLVLLTSLQLLVLPLTAILEGCGQLGIINRIRFAYGIIGSLVVWAMMLSGLGLWALCGSAAVRLVGECYLVGIRYRGFFAPFLRAPQNGRVDWKGEILPLQWRMAIQGAIQWLGSHLTVLVVVASSGKAAGGRFGMMWTILTAVQGLAIAWIDTRRPLFGTLIADKNYAELDRQFFRFGRISVLLTFVGTNLFVAGLWVVNYFPNWLFDAIASRLPPVPDAAILAMAFVIMQFALCANIYVRAHKKDPFMLASVVSNLSIAGLILWLGPKHGVTGVVTGYLIGVGAVLVPLWVGIWWVTRKRWHAVGLSERQS